MFPVRLVDYWLRRRVQHVIVHVTNRCNLRCAHCFVDFTPAPEIPLERFQELGREMGSLYWLDIAGGEPFLREELPQIVGAFEAEIVQIPTNGSRPAAFAAAAREVVRQARARVAVSISIDGLEDLHDRIRGRPGLWGKAWETFDALREQGIPLKINTVLTNQNQGEILKLMEYVRGRNPDFHSIILHRGASLQEGVGLPPLPEVRAMGPDVFAILGTYTYGQNAAMAHVLRNYHRYLWNLSLQTLERETQVIPCLAGQAHLVVLGNGAVSSCEMLPPVGNIRQQAWGDILGSDALRRQRESIRRKDCFCTHNCAMLDSIFFRLESFFPLLHQRVAA